MSDYREADFGAITFPSRSCSNRLSLWPTRDGSPGGLFILHYERICNLCRLKRIKSEEVGSCKVLSKKAKQTPTKLPSHLFDRNLDSCGRRKMEATLHSIPDCEKRHLPLGKRLGNH